MPGLIIVETRNSKKSSAPHRGSAPGHVVGRKVVFHGAFASKADAVAKEREVGKGAYVQAKRVKGRGLRYLVLTRR